MAKQLQDVVAQLYDHSTRRDARQKLVAGRHVDVLLECLASGNESVIWAAVQSLGELRATEAVRPLIELLDRRVLALDVAEALTQITGEDFGTDAASWREWLASAPAGDSKDPDPAKCAQAAGNFLGVEPRGKGASFCFELSLPEGRRQQVKVFFGRPDADGESLVVVYSECGPAQEKLYEAVLRKNLKMPAGAFGIRDVDGVPHFVLVDTMPAVAVTPRLLAKSIEQIASRADVVEKGLTGMDTR